MMLVAGLRVIVLIFCFGSLARVTQASCIEASPERVLMQSEVAPKSLRGVREIALYADQAKPHAVQVAAFDPACKEIASYGFDKSYNAAAFLFVDLPVIGTSVIVEAQSFYCGSGAKLQPIILAMRGSRLATIAPPMLEHSNMDGYAFDDVAHDRLALVTWNAIWVGAEAHMSPHRYEVTTYSWSGNAFRKTTSQTTAQKYTWMHDAKAQPISPLSDPALTLLTSFSNPLPANWDGRFQLRQTEWGPDCRADAQ